MYPKLMLFFSMFIDNLDILIHCSFHLHWKNKPRYDHSHYVTWQPTTSQQFTAHSRPPAITVECVSDYDSCKQLPPTCKGCNIHIYNTAQGDHLQRLTHPAGKLPNVLHSELWDSQSSTDRQMHHQIPRIMMQYFLDHNTQTTEFHETNDCPLPILTTIRPFTNSLLLK